MKWLWMGTLALVQTGGCALTIDSARKQCASATECADQLGAATSYECVDGLCRTKTECSTNKECVEPGESVCAAGRCVGCAVATDCQSATATCVDSVCVDDEWACVSEPDSRAVATQSAASITLQIVDPVSDTPVQGETSVKVCLSSQVDPGCQQTFPNASAEYDDQSGFLSATGIPQGLIYRLLSRPPASSGMLAMEYISNRVARDVETPEPVFFTPAFVIDDNAFQSPKPIAPDKALVSLRVYNCLGNHAQGVTMTVTGGDPDMVLAYPDETKLPNYANTATTRAGTVGLINAPVGRPSTLTVTSGTKTVIVFATTFQGNRITTAVDLYPRIFSSN